MKKFFVLFLFMFACGKDPVVVPKQPIEPPKGPELTAPMEEPTMAPAVMSPSENTTPTESMDASGVSLDMPPAMDTPEMK